MNEMVSPLAQTRLFGHNDMLANWQQAFTDNKLHHGLLVTGVQGSGKATLTYQFLKWLFAQSSAQPQLITKQMIASSYPGLKIVERLFDEKRQRYAGEITLDATAPIFDFLRLSVLGGGCRAIVIDGADRMNRNAQNTILKLLEEPPPKTFFFLLAEQPGQLLPTIRSRCMRHALNPLSHTDFSAALTVLAPDVPSSMHDALHVLGEGALGQAIQWHAQNWSGLYQEAVTAALSALQGQMKPAMKWAETYALAAQEVEYDLLRDLLLKRFAAIVTQLRESTSIQPLLLDETLLIAHWRQQNTMALLDAYDRLNQILRTGERSHLDRKLVLLQALQAFTVRHDAVAPRTAAR